MRTRFRFEKLEVWQAARKINQFVYRLTQNFPRRELFAMTSQLRRVAVSISANIAEGAGRNSDKDFAHYLEQGYGSLMEVAAIFYLALDDGYVNSSELELLAKRIAALNRSLSISASKTPFVRTRSPALDPRPSTLD